MNRSALMQRLHIEPPRWRGRLHAWAVAVAVPAGFGLVLSASSAAATVVAAIYAAALVAMLATSAAYHRLAKSAMAKRWMQRADHSTIFLLIAATYTPVCWLLLPRSWGVPMLVGVWAGAAAGIVIKLAAFDRLKTLGYTLYPVLGWAAVVAAPVLLQRLSVLQLVLLVTGGLAYTVGFVVLLLRRPDPWPRTFGYHEVWHGLTLAASASHFALVTTIVHR